MHDGAGDVFHAFHQLDQLVAIFRATGRKANAAIAHDHRGHAMQRAWGHVRVPNRLSVIMSVDVDEAGRNQLARGVDFFGGCAGHFADGGNDAVFDANIGSKGLSAGAVNDGAVADDQVIFIGHRISSIKALPQKILRKL